MSPVRTRRRLDTIPADLMPGFDKLVARHRHRQIVDCRSAGADHPVAHPEVRAQREPLVRRVPGPVRARQQKKTAAA
ncbi:hypothetical protein [Streptomyces sp. NPDC057889]|uniref:hypothetical protein n=1 Tax=unclassified Streptomyces TaxID=2593676 RepID=UPI0036C492EF